MVQVAEYLGIGIRTVKRKVASGELGHIRLGPKTVRITDEQLAEYIDRHTVDADLAV